MKTLVRAEELAMFGICIYALYLFHVPWWCYVLLALGPDIGMIGYAAGNRVGAVTYNLFHHKGIAVVVFFIGLLLPSAGLQIAGIILFGHSAMDRALGYGLKYFRGFRYTHLGEIGVGPQRAAE